MQISIPYHTKFESSLGYETVLNYAMPYLIMLIMISPEFSKDLENNYINLWPKRNSIILDRMMMEVYNKWVLELEYKKGQQD